MTAGTQGFLLTGNNSHETDNGSGPNHLRSQILYTKNLIIISVATFDHNSKHTYMFTMNPITNWSKTDERIDISYESCYPPKAQVPPITSLAEYILYSAYRSAYHDTPECGRLSMRVVTIVELPAYHRIRPKKSTSPKFLIK
jgi:hypothetical protein